MFERESAEYTPGAPELSPALRFSEAGAWQPVGDGWRPLHGSFRDFGYSIEWHEFQVGNDLDWSRSFHPDAVEICLNLDGRGVVAAGRRQVEFAPQTLGFYVQGETTLKGLRIGGERHRFVTIEISRAFLARHIAFQDTGLHPCLQELHNGRPVAHVSEPVRLTSDHLEFIRVLRHPPVNTSAQRLWAHGKVLEIASSIVYPSSQEPGMFCDRVKRLNQDRVQKVVSLLRENLAEPLSLQEIGKRVGCSHFHLSRIFSEAMGHGIIQHLRELRMERAAALLGEGNMKITQVAMEVGYASPSHFTVAFREAFGCCPGLYPVSTLPSPAKRRRT